ncbi:MAG: hypothetical protein IJ501_04255 [Bacilli bacterium]|nr:hypothetical protein [Bacilli bacterium]
MLNFYSSDLEVLITIILISILTVIIYDLIKTKGKLYLSIYKMKINVINKNNWNELTNKTGNDTKHVELDFIFQIFNNKNNYNSVYNLSVLKKNKFKYQLINNHYLNLTDTMKSISGTNTYEKLKYVNLLPFEVKEYRIKIKLDKEEFDNIKKYPIYIKYKTKNRFKKIKLNKYLKLDDKKK